MTLAEARARLPGLRIATFDPAADEKALFWLGDWAIRFGPSVHVLPPRAVAVEIGGSAHLFGGESALAEQAKRLLTERGFQVAAAVAGTVGTAYALATSIGIGGPAAIVPAGKEASALGPLKVAALRIEEGDVRRLQSFGVRSIEQVLGLPRADLRMRFGASLVQRIAEALGEADEVLPLHSPGARFRAALGFSDPIEGGEMVMHGVASLVDEAADWLLARLEGTCRLALEIVSEEGETSLEVGFASPAREPKRLLSVCRLALERSRVSGRVTSIVLEVLETAPMPFVQRRLVSGGVAESPGVGAVIDSLAAQLGERRVLRSELLEDHRPECAFRLRSAVRAIGGSRGALHGLVGLREREAISWRGRPPPRPSRLWRPRPIEVVIGSGLQPKEVQPRIGAVRVVRGPERLAEAWWTSPTPGVEEKERTLRDYYEVEATDGRRLWIYSEGSGGRWFWHGVF
jgi:protein ImuB